MPEDFDFVDSPEPTANPTPAAPTPAAPPPAARPKPAPAPEVDPLYRSPASVGLGLLLILGLLGGLGYLGYDSIQHPPAAPEAPAPGAATPAPAPDATPQPDAKPEAKPAEAFAPTTTPNMAAELTGEINALKAALKSTSDQVAELSARPAPDAKAMEEKLAKVAAAAEPLADVPAKLAALDEKVAAMAKPEAADSAKVAAVEKRLGEVAGELDALKASIAAMASKPAAPAGDAPKPAEDVNKADAAMSEAVDLFNQRKYAESLVRFTKLQGDHPEDARVWYFSALSNGLATRDWRGETERLVNLGVEKEKAGSPESSKIDAIFATLTAANGKDWLAAYRARAARR